MTVGWVGYVLTRGARRALVQTTVKSKDRNSSLTCQKLHTGNRTLTSEWKWHSLSFLIRVFNVEFLKSDSLNLRIVNYYFIVIIKMCQFSRSFYFKRDYFLCLEIYTNVFYYTSSTQEPLFCPLRPVHFWHSAWKWAMQGGVVGRQSLESRAWAPSV